MFRNIMLFSLLMLTMLFCNSCGTVHGYVRTGLSLGNGTYFDQGGSSSASLRIFYGVSRDGSRSTCEGGIIDFGRAMGGEIFIVPESDRPIKSMTIMWADGRSKMIPTPSQVFDPRFGVRGIREAIHPKWTGEVLTITVYYCDAWGKTEAPQLYAYTVTGGTR